MSENLAPRLAAPVSRTITGTSATETTAVEQSIGLLGLPFAGVEQSVNDFGRLPFAGVEQSRLDGSLMPFAGEGAE